MNPLLWPELSELLHILATRSALEWRVEPARHGQIEPAMLQAAIAAACVAQANNLSQVPVVSADVQPWLLRRMLAAELFCSGQAQANAELFPLPLNIQVEFLLTAAWNASLKAGWEQQSF